MNLLEGLSIFWTRLVADAPLLQTFYTGAMELWEQAYLRLLESTLTLCLKDTPVFRKEFFKLLRFGKNDFTLINNKYAYDLSSTSVRNFLFLCNKILSPTVILERDIDFEFVTQDNKVYVAFTKNLFDWDGAGNKIPGVPWVVVQDKEYLLFWAPNVEFDASDLYVHYGYLVDRYSTSSKAYKAFLEGLFFYYTIGGPTLEYIKSMMHIICGLPVVEDVEILQQVDSSETEQKVITDKNTYIFHYLIPLRKDLLDSRNWGSLQLLPFESLTTVFSVADYISDPTWFYGETVDPRLAPKQSAERRVGDVNLYENLIDNPERRICIGDPGFYIGADDTGYVPQSRKPFRHAYSWWIYNLLKPNILFIKIEESIFTENVITFYEVANELRGLVIPGKPAYVFLGALLPQNFLDFLLLREEFEVNSNVIPTEILENVNFANPGLSIGDMWKVDNYYYWDSNGNLNFAEGFNGKTFPNAAGEVPFYIGMENPFVGTPANLGFWDSPLAISSA